MGQQEGRRDASDDFQHERERRWRTVTRAVSRSIAPSCCCTLALSDSHTGHLDSEQRHDGAAGYARPTGAMRLLFSSTSANGGGCTATRARAQAALPHRAAALSRSCWTTISACWIPNSATMGQQEAAPTGEDASVRFPARARYGGGALATRAAVQWGIAPSCCCTSRPVATTISRHVLDSEQTHHTRWGTRKLRPTGGMRLFVFQARARYGGGDTATRAVSRSIAPSCCCTARPVRQPYRPLGYRTATPRGSRKLASGWDASVVFQHERERRWRTATLGEAQACIAPSCLLHSRPFDNHSRPDMDVRHGDTMGQQEGRQRALMRLYVFQHERERRWRTCWKTYRLIPPVAEHRAAASSRPVRTTIVGRLWMSEQRRRWGSKKRWGNAA